MKLKQDFGVRALLGVLVVAPAMVAIVVLAIRGSEEALRYLGELVLVVVAFYFGFRRGGDQTQRGK